MSVPLTDQAATFDRAAETYDRVGVDFFARFGAMLVDAVGLTTGQSVLDIGTGRGAVLGPAARAVGPSGRTVGVDLAPTMVRLTAEELDHLPQVEVRQADAAELPDDVGRFDAVLSSLVVFFTADPAATLAHWASFVRPGGVLGLVTFVSDPDDDRFGDLLSDFLPAEHGPAEPDPSRPRNPFELVRDPDWLDTALTDAGLATTSAATHRHAARFDDVDQWWDWAWSHGMRGALELVAPEDVDAVKDAGGAELDAHRLDDGGLGLHVSIRITLARRA